MNDTNSSSTEDSRALRALSILDQLAVAGQPFTLSQLAARLHIPKATLARLIESLEAQGYVMHLPDSRGTDRGITLGPRAAQLALAILADALDDDKRAKRLHQRFKFRFIGALDMGGCWVISIDEVRAIADAIEADDKADSGLLA